MHYSGESTGPRPLPLPHACTAFEGALERGEFHRIEPGFYIKILEWADLPPEMAAQFRESMLAQLRTQDPGITELPPEARPYAVIAKCPYCDGALVDSA